MTKKKMTIEDLAGKFDHLTTKVDTLATTMAEGFRNTKKDTAALAASTNKRFDGVDKRFDEQKKDVDKRFDGIDKRFDQTKKDYTLAIDSAIDKFAISVQNGFLDIQERMDTRFDNLEKQNEIDHTFIRSEISSELHPIKEDIKEIKQKVTAIGKQSMEDSSLALDEIEKLKKRMAVSGNQ